MEQELSLKEVKKEWHGTVKSYALGFIFSLALTVASFLIVMINAIPGLTQVLTIVTLALLQAAFQLRLFLHVGQEAKPRWETLVFLFMLGILLIIVLGSLWIMNDLNDRVMSNMNEGKHD